MRDASPNRLVYLLTPRGVARKARLTYEFMKYSLDFYRDARQHLRRSLSLVVADGRAWRFTGRVTPPSSCSCSCKDMGLELTAVFTLEGDGQFLGFPVRPIADQANVSYDVLIVAVLEQTSGYRATASTVGGAGREGLDAPADAPHLLLRHTASLG